MAEFLNMGGYAAFIWPAWGVGVMILVMITAHSFTRQNRAQTKLSMLEAARKSTGKKAKSNG